MNFTNINLKKIIVGLSSIATVILPLPVLAAYEDPHAISPTGDGNLFPIDASAANGYHVRLDHDEVPVDIQFDGSCSDAAQIQNPADPTPSGIAQPEGQLNRYIRVLVDCSPAASDVDHATVYFMVDKVWLSQQNTIDESVVLHWFNNSSGQWENLATSITREDSTYVYFQSRTTQLGLFAVTANENLTAPTGDNLFLVLAGASFSLVLGSAFLWQVLKKNEGSV